MISSAPSDLSLLLQDRSVHAALVRELRTGRTEAFKRVVDGFQEQLIRFARRQLDGVGDPEDVVQEAFVRFWLNRERLHPSGSIRALLFRTVRSLAADEHRRWKRRARSQAMTPQLTANDSPLDLLLSFELKSLADSAVHQLPPRRKTIWQMVRERGLSHQETAAALGVSTQTVSNTMSSALAQIRDSLRPVLEEAG